MKLKRIAAFVLILYAAITVAFVFHDHLKEQPGNHCNICQILHAPAHTPALTSHTPVLAANGTFVPTLQVSANQLLIFPCSERAPPTL
ncbi:hypothetical protein L0244_02950 [bacterium]|nr:hypothetical protein [bacterium]